MSIDEETRPIGTSPGISTVSVPPMRSGSTASTTHRAPAAGRRFARREFARQPSLRETQEREGGVLPRVQPFLGVAADGSYVLVDSLTDAIAASEPGSASRRLCIFAAFDELLPTGAVSF